MKIRVGETIRIRGSKTGRTFIVDSFRGCRAVLRPEDAKDKRQLIEPLDNIIRVR
jgi:hypothetical protein